jgi:hypothetical protein
VVPGYHPTSSRTPGDDGGSAAVHAPIFVSVICIPSAIVDAVQFAAEVLFADRGEYAAIEQAERHDVTTHRADRLRPGW